MAIEGEAYPRKPFFVDASAAVTFIDEWAGERHLIELYVWRWPLGGIDPSELGEFWLNLAEGSISGTQLS